MQKYKKLFVLMMTLLVFLITGCNKAEEKSDNLKNKSSAAISTTEASKSIQAKSESYTQENPDIINDFTCSELTDDMAAKIGNEVKEIMTDGQKGTHKLDNFTIAFSNQTKKDKDIFIDITVMADWKTIRKPEDSPVIIGMNEVVRERKLNL